MTVIPTTSVPFETYAPIRNVASDLYCVDGEWQKTAFRRRMTVIRLMDGSLVIHSAIRMRDHDLAELDQLGPVSIIIIPNIFHDSEAVFYANRYPNASVYVPEKIKAKCSRRFKVKGALETNWPFQDELPCIRFKILWPQNPCLFT